MIYRKFKELICCLFLLCCLIFKSEASVYQQQKDSLLNYPNAFIAPIHLHNAGPYAVSNVPDPKKGKANGYISDPDNYINDTEEYEINKMLWELEQKTTAQVAVVILNDIGNEVPKDFAVELFEKWGIGYGDKDNGLLILTVINQRRTEFEVGYGLEPILTDLLCHRIGTEEIVPYFKQAAYGKGLLSAIGKVKQIIEEPSVANEIYSKEINYNDKLLSWSKYSSTLVLGGLYLLITLIIILVDFLRIRVIDQSKEEFYDKYNDLKELKSNRYGCLVFLATLMFPFTYLFYYKYSKRKSKEYRYSPRFSRVNGKKMFLQDEWKENKFLEKSNILEEKLKSVRYDVWVTEDESDIMILLYEGASEKYSKCKECGYKTYGLLNTLVVISATYKKQGKRKIVHLCRNCNYRTSKTEVIPIKIRHTSSSSSSGSSSWSSSSSSSSSSSWGGGSSGGGGSGVSW